MSPKNQLGKSNVCDLVVKTTQEIIEKMHSIRGKHSNVSACHFLLVHIAIYQKKRFLSTKHYTQMAILAEMLKKTQKCDTMYLILGGGAQ